MSKVKVLWRTDSRTEGRTEKGRTRFNSPCFLLKAGDTKTRDKLNSLKYFAKTEYVDKPINTILILF